MWLKERNESFQGFPTLLLVAVILLSVTDERCTEGLTCIPSHFSFFRPVWQLLFPLLSHGGAMIWGIFVWGNFCLCSEHEQLNFVSYGLMLPPGFHLFKLSAGLHYRHHSVSNGLGLVSYRGSCRYSPVGHTDSSHSRCLI